ncbi:MAG: putative porin [Omnitrophica bacterium]|nr:putative porin [Candidatus Omnitrophota bacterium]
MKKILALTIILGIVFMSVPSLYADETSELILKLLIKKGIISQSEVNALKREIDKKTQKIPDVADIQSHVKKASWADKIKFKGDIRLRNEYQRPGSGAYVNRQRIRARAGLEVKIADNLKGGVMLATGGTDNARSTNQTLGDAFGTKPFDLDMAYLEWKPVNFMKIAGGKYKNPLYHPGDLLWDSDIRFEGVSSNIKYPLKEEFGIPANLMLNTGIFILDDLAIDKKNPWLYTIQAGLGSSLGDTFDFKSYVSYLDFAHIKGTRSGDFVPTTGRADGDDLYYYDYNILELSGDLTIHYLEQVGPKPFDVPITVFGDYAQNLADGAKRNAWELGVKLGNRPEKFADWRFIYNFRSLDKNSFPEEFPDADAFGGRPDGYGHETILSLGLTKNVWLEFDYYLFRDKSIGSDPNDKWGSIFQTDINAKF